MGPDMSILTERDGWLYIKNCYTDWGTPKQITLWWPIGIHTSDFRYRFPCPRMTPLSLQEHLGQKMQTLGNGFFSDECGMTYRLKDGGATQADLVETTDLAPPKQRGRKLPIRWYQGQWEKETTHGWVSAGTLLIDM